MLRALTFLCLIVAVGFVFGGWNNFKLQAIGLLAAFMGFHFNRASHHVR